MTWILLDIQIFLYIQFLTCVPNFNIITGLKVCQEPPRHHQWLGGYWGFLTGDMKVIGDPCHHNCSLCWILDLCTKFQHSSMIRSVSRTNCPWWGYLEDAEGSWQETWRTGSSLLSWMTLVEPKDHILKVSCHYLYFWQRYKGVTIRNKNVTEDRQTDRQTKRQRDTAQF